MISDIPRVVFFDKLSIFLKEEHKSFLEPLIVSGIFQTNPINASKHIEKIYNDPLEWWKSSKVRKSRNLFLKNNIGEKEIFINQISNISYSLH